MATSSICDLPWYYSCIFLHSQASIAQLQRAWGDETGIDLEKLTETDDFQSNALGRSKAPRMACAKARIWLQAS